MNDFSFVKNENKYVNFLFFFLRIAYLASILIFIGVKIYYYFSNLSCFYCKNLTFVNFYIIEIFTDFMTSLWNLGGFVWLTDFFVIFYMCKLYEIRVFCFFLLFVYKSVLVSDDLGSTFSKTKKLEYLCECWFVFMLLLFDARLALSKRCFLLERA